MTTRSALLLLATQSMLPWVRPCAAAPVVPPAKPNVVVILVDDLGYADIGPFGATRQKTPCLDQMAREGMKLTSFYAGPVCSVSRAQFLTGCYGARVSVPGVYMPASPNGLNPAEYTIAERLKECGYATMCIGKWHVGDQPQFLPTRQGFDHYFGIPYSNDMQRPAAAGEERVVPLLRDEAVAELLTDKAQDRIVERYTDEAVKFIRARKDGPFLLYLAHTAVHVPLHPGAAFAGKSANGSFGDWVEEVDASTGRVLETLRELHLDERTLVIFTSDNGPWLTQGKNAGSALPLRGGKGSTWEGGVRVPAIARWPGKIAAGSVCDAVAGTIDLLPTTVALAGGALPAEPVVDGRDITPLLLGKATVSTREAHYYFRNYQLQAVRQGPWKLAVTPQHEPSARGESTIIGGVEPRLYQLDDDIGERRDVAAEHPDVVARLQALAQRMNEEIGGKTPRARRPAGVAPAPRMIYQKESGAATNGADNGGGAVVPASETRVYKKVAGRELRLWLEKPADWRATDKRPAVLFFFGGGWVGGTPEQFLQQSQYLASRGMIGIRVEYRTTKQGPPVECCQDAKSALRHVRAHAAQLGIDPARIAAAGGSAGGHLAAFTGLVDGLDDPADDLKVSCKPQALLLFNPVIDNGPGQWGYSRLGERYKEFSPAEHVAKGAPPTIFFLGEKDALIPVAVAQRFQQRMKAVDARCDLHLYPKAGHGFFNRGPHFTQTLLECDRFLVSLGWLKGPATPVGKKQ